MLLLILDLDKVTSLLVWVNFDILFDLTWPDSVCLASAHWRRDRWFESHIQNETGPMLSIRWSYFILLANGLCGACASRAHCPHFLIDFVGYPLLPFAFNLLEWFGCELIHLRSINRNGIVIVSGWMVAPDVLYLRERKKGINIKASKSCSVRWKGKRLWLVRWSNERWWHWRHFHADLASRCTTSTTSFQWDCVITISERIMCANSNSLWQVNDFRVQFVEMENYASSTINRHNAWHSFANATAIIITRLQSATERHGMSWKGFWHPAHGDRLVLIMNVIKFNRNQFGAEKHVIISRIQIRYSSSHRTHSPVYFDSFMIFINCARQANGTMWNVIKKMIFCFCFEKRTRAEWLRTRRQGGGGLPIFQFARNVLTPTIFNINLDVRASCKR